MFAEFTEDVVETICSAARKLTGFARRQFQAEVTLKYCAGKPRRAEAVFGWGREAVRTGLGELRSGIRCLDNFQERGRKRCEEQDPELTRDVRAIVEPHTQADPKFQTPLAFTRITAPAVHEQLTQRLADASRAVPSERTVLRLLNRLGIRLRRVRKTEPKKNSRDRRHLRASEDGSRARRQRAENAANFVGHEGQGQDRPVLARRPVARRPGGESG